MLGRTIKITIRFDGVRKHCKLSSLAGAALSSKAVVQMDGWWLPCIATGKCNFAFDTDPDNMWSKFNLALKSALD